MRASARLLTAALCFSLYAPLEANTYGSVEPFATTPDVIDTTLLLEQPLKVREAFAARDCCSAAS